MAIQPNSSYNRRKHIIQQTAFGCFRLLKQELGKIYADSGNNIQVTLGNIRTIQVNVMGEVMAPGRMNCLVHLE